MKLRLTLDPQVDAEVIAALKNRANGGSISRALYVILLEWCFIKSANTAPAPPAFSGHVEIEQERKPNGVSNNLAEALDSINDEW